jgi:hypothetical protein
VWVSTRRAAIWAPPWFFLVLSLIVMAGADEAGTRFFFAFMALATGCWLIRSLRVGVGLTAEVVIVRGQMRTRRYPWSKVRQARVAPMRTRSPLSDRFPYVALELELDTGETRLFEDISTKAPDRTTIEAIAHSINTGPPVGH